MKSVIAIATIVLALSLCNLTGRRANVNSNDNRPPSGTTEESASNQNSSAQEKQAPPPIGSGLPPAQNRNSNAARPGSSGPASTLPGVNQNTAANIPRAPISGGVLNGKATYLPKPAYPAIAKAAHASGTVNVQVTIDESGNVVSARPISGHPLLQSSAAAAARQAKFSPTKLSGQPVKVTGVIIYNFVSQ